MTPSTQTFPVTVTNTGNQTWSAGGTNPARLGVHFAATGGGYAANGGTWYTDQRFSLPGDLATGATVTISVTVSAPTGNLVLEAQMVKEDQFWFAQFADTSVSVVGPDRLGIHQSIGVGGRLTSADGRFSLVLQSDSNLVLYGPTGALWWTSTVGSGANLLVMQGDGNLVLYAPTRAVWSTSTAGARNIAVVQSDGNFVVYSPSQAVWASGTGGR